MTPREFLELFFDLINRREYDSAMALVHPEYTEEYPQSGERVRGPASLRATIDNYPGGVGEVLKEPSFFGKDEEWLITPAYTVVRVTDTGNKGTAILKIRYPDGTDWWMVALFEIKDDLLYRQTSFFAAPFEAPEWRSAWVERFDP